MDSILQAGGHAVSVPGDITSPTLPQALVDTALQQFHSLDIIINNAGYT